MKKTVLAFDFGASSGRAMLCDFDGEKIEARELCRFPNDPVFVNGTMYWDILRLYHELKQAIIKAVNVCEISGIGIDTWGCDFGLIDKNGALLENPVHYRDLRTEGVPEEVFKIVPREKVYSMTGIQHMRINTLYQLASLKFKRPEKLEATDKILMIPDLFAYFLTGVMREEYTVASTADIASPYQPEWQTELIKSLGLPERIFAPMILPGEMYGYLSDSICEELNCPKIPVFAVATHDTASAVAGVPAESKDFAYLSSGTWSLMGTELSSPVITDDSCKLNYTNEKGVDNTTRFLKNIMGLWLIEESRRAWRKNGEDVSFDVLTAEALQAKSGVHTIDPDDARFETAGDMPQRIRDYVVEKGQPSIQTRGEVVRCILESLAKKYKKTLGELEQLTGKKFDCLHIVGGGIKNKLLCQLAANECGITVKAGPTEAAVMGNAAMQFIALGLIKDLAEARKVIGRSEPITVYTPENK